MAPGARLDELTAKYMQNPRRYFVPLADEYRLGGDADRAIALCREHLSAQPGHMSGHIVLARAYFDKGDLEAAREVFVSAVSLDDENLIALRHLGDIARLRNEPVAAREWYAKVLDADPDNAQVAASLATLTDASGIEDTFQPDVTQPAPESVEFVDRELESAIDEGISSALADPTPPGLRAIISGPDVPSPDVDRSRPSAGFEPIAARPLETLDLSTLDDLADPVEPSAAADATGIWNELVGAMDPVLDLAAVGTGFAFDDLDELTPPIRTAELESQPLPSESDVVVLEPTEDGTGGASTVAGEVSPDDLLSRPGFGALASFASWRSAQARLTPSVQPAVPSPAEVLGAPDHASSVLDEHELFWSPDSSESAATAPEFVTETMAALYLQQGFRQQALEVYLALLARTPGDNVLRGRVSALQIELSAVAPDDALQVDADNALSFKDLDESMSEESGLSSTLSTRPQESSAPAGGSADRANSSAAWSTGLASSTDGAATEDDWFTDETEVDPVGEPPFATDEIFGIAASGFSRSGPPSSDFDLSFATPHNVGAVVLESVFGEPVVSPADETSAGMLLQLAEQMVGRLPKESPTLPVPDVLELPSAGEMSDTAGATPAPLLSFDRFFSGSGAPPRPRVDTPIRGVGGVELGSTPTPAPASPSLSPTFGGVPLTTPAGGAAPSWAGFDQFLAPPARTNATQAPLTPSVPPVVPPAAVAESVPQQSGAAAPLPTPPASPAEPGTRPVEPGAQAEPPRAAPSDFHRWLEGLA